MTIEIGATPINYNRRARGYKEISLYKNLFSDLDKESQTTQAHSLFLFGESKSAIEDCDELIRLDQKYSKAFLIRGECHFFQNEVDQAFSDFDMGIKLDPNNKEGSLVRSRVFLHIPQKRYIPALFI
ncbi:unnamed protein product [marine sediment metagenome]|uniref:Uncharacterized protein n=1 Tax=marine sediment metagenome TaxID=412755 RepID=X0VQG9_9ZZZZ